MGTILSEPRMAQYNRIGDDAISDGRVRHAADVIILRAGYLGGSGASMVRPGSASDVTLAVNRFVLSVIGSEGRTRSSRDPIRALAPTLTCRVGFEAKESSVDGAGSQ
jgi:hypothetical protein